MRIAPSIVCLAMATALLAATPRPDPEEPWAAAWRKGPLSADETKAFMARLTRFIAQNHLKAAPASPQRGMVYEYLDMTRRGKTGQFIQGEGLDTMHDGAWLAAAMVNAFRATGDASYREFLTRWQLPFYLKMLNHSDELFTTRGAVARKGAPPWGKGWAFQEGEKGFIPYYWDDGGSVSIERRTGEKFLPIRPSHDNLHGKPNPDGRLDGYSLGMSNHMAQDIGVMVQLAWLLFKDSKEPADRKLAAELAEAAKNLHECRMRHHGPIPMTVSPTALANADATMMRKWVPDPASASLWSPANHYTRAAYAPAPGKRMPTPSFMDGAQYGYYYGIARAGGKLPKPLAFRVVYDAYTEPMLYAWFSDDAVVPAGINRSEAGFSYGNGKPQQYRSERKGPHGKPFPMGSRMGPQNMVCCGWALQALRAYPGIWEERYTRQFAAEPRIVIHDPPPGTQMKAPKPAELRLGDVALFLSSTRNALAVRGLGPEEFTLRIFAGPEPKGSHAIVTVGENWTVAAENDREQALVVRSTPVRSHTFSFELPYAAVKGQKPWANGCEHCRYAIQVGNELDGFQTRVVYMASREAQVKAWLERELGCGLRTWRTIFEQLGYIPCGIHSWGFWDRVSDSGGYAHLISAGAQWLLCLDGRSDWELHHIPTVLESR